MSNNDKSTEEIKFLHGQPNTYEKQAIRQAFMQIKKEDTVPLQVDTWSKTGRANQQNKLVEGIPAFVNLAKVIKNL